MELLSYDSFSALRIEQFVPAGATVDEWSDGYDGHPICRCEHMFVFRPHTMFGYAESPPTTLTIIDATIADDELPAAAGDRLLRTLHVPISIRGTVEELLSTFGKPDYAWPKPSAQGRQFLRFRVGEKWPYVLGFGVRLTGGIDRFWMGRADFYAGE